MSDKMELDFPESAGGKSLKKKAEECNESRGRRSRSDHHMERRICSRSRSRDRSSGWNRSKTSRSRDQPIMGRYMAPPYSDNRESHGRGRLYSNRMDRLRADSNHFVNGKSYEQRIRSPERRSRTRDRKRSVSPDIWQHDQWELCERDKSPSPQPEFMSLRFLRKLQSEEYRGTRPFAEETASTIASTDVHPPSSIGHESGHETGADESSCLLNISNPCSPSHSHASEYDGPIRYSEPLTSPATSLLSG